MYLINVCNDYFSKPIETIGPVLEIEEVVHVVKGLYQKHKQKEFTGSIEIQNAEKEIEFLYVDEVSINEVDKVLKHIKMKLQLKKWEKAEDYPVIDMEKRKSAYSEFPCFIWAPNKTYEEHVDIKNIFGDNWAFDKKENRGNYPRINKLFSILKGFLEIDGPNKVPPVPIIKIKGMYFLSEGNHRLYMSKLLKKKTLYAEVCEYDYDTFLLHANLIKFGESYRVVYNNSVHMVSEEEAATFEKLKENN